MQYPKPILDLIDSYSLLPGIGRKTAIRLAFHTLKMNDNDINNFAKSLVELKEKLTNWRIVINTSLGEAKTKFKIRSIYNYINC